MKIPFFSSAKPPRQDPTLWGQELFVNVPAPVDWCTVGQAQEHRNDWKPNSLLDDIASGRIDSAVYSRAEAQLLLDRQTGRSKET